MNKFSTKRIAMWAIALLTISSVAFAAFNLLDPYPSSLDAGTTRQESGRIISVLESEMIHSDNSSGTDTWINKGQPLIVGSGYFNGRALTGVARGSANASTDHVAVATDGVFNLSITPTDDVAYGTELYLGNSSGNITSNGTTVNHLFGWSLAADTVSSPSTTVIPIRLYRR